MTPDKDTTTSAPNTFSNKTNTDELSNNMTTDGVGADVVAYAFLPQKVYETLRWLVWIVLPATATFISVLNGAWKWGLPIEAILTTFSGVETFLGTILGISKVLTDAPEIKS